MDNSKDTYITIKILKSDLYEIQRALKYAMGYLNADGKRYSNRFKTESASTKIAEGFLETYERIINSTKS